MSGDQQTRDGEEINEKWKEWTESMKAILSRFRQNSKPFSISIVPEELRKWNENAYMPKAICIGPRYKGTRKDLLQMEETKWHCVLSLLHRPKDHTAKQNLEKCGKLFSKLDKEVRTSYVGDLKLKKEDLAQIMLCDACFLLELLICKSKNLDEKIKTRLNPPHPGPQVVEKEHKLTDLLVLENQIPLVVLHKLSDELFGEGVVSVETLALNLFGYSPDRRFESGYSASHFLELVHSYISWKSDKNQQEEEEFQETQHDRSVIAIDIESPQAELHHCAPILEAAGVKIITRGQDVRSGFDFHIKFNKINGMLKIPPLHITMETEVRWRNLIAWEQSHTGFEYRHNCTWAAMLFNALICCEKDVQLLKERQVIAVDHHLKRSNKQLLEFFRSMVKGVDRSKITDSRYWKMVDELNQFSARNRAKQIPAKMWHSWLPKLSQKTGNYLLRGYNFMLTAISILAIVQTYYAIVSYYYPKH